MTAGRPLALVAGLLVAVQLPLALSAPTALFGVVAYALQCAAITSGAAVDAFQGRAARCRWWGFSHLVASVFVVAALDVGGRVHGAALAHWGVPFAFVLAVGWIPPLLSFGLAAFASDRGRRRIRRVVRARRAAAAEVQAPRG